MIAVFQVGGCKNFSCMPILPSKLISAHRAEEKYEKTQAFLNINYGFTG